MTVAAANRVLGALAACAALAARCGGSSAGGHWRTQHGTLVVR